MMQWFFHISILIFVVFIPIFLLLYLWTYMRYLLNSVAIKELWREPLNLSLKGRGIVLNFCFHLFLASLQRFSELIIVKFFSVCYQTAFFIPVILLWNCLAKELKYCLWQNETRFFFLLFSKLSSVIQCILYSDFPSVA